MGVLPGAVVPNIRQFQMLHHNHTSSTDTSQLGTLNFLVDNLAIALPLGVALCTLSLLTFLGNAMVVHAIRTERKLHTVSNMFILSLAVADLIVGLIVMPISSIYVLFADWMLGIFVCQLWLVIDYTASTASIFNLLILSLDRYWSIRSPLKYLCKRTKKRALVMIAIVWMISALWAIPIIGWHIWYNDGVRKHPHNVCETEFSDSVAFKITTSIANFLVPMSLIVIIYYKIFCEIKRRGNFSEINRNINRVSCAHHRAHHKQSPERSSTSVRTGKNSQSKVIAEEEAEDDIDHGDIDVDVDGNRGAGEDSEAEEDNSDSHCSFQSEVATGGSSQKRQNFFYRLFYTFKDSKTSSRTSITTSTLAPILPPPAPPPAPVSAPSLAAPSCSTSLRRVHVLQHQHHQADNNVPPPPSSVSSPPPPLASGQFSPNLRDFRREQLNCDNGHRILNNKLTEMYFNAAAKAETEDTNNNKANGSVVVAGTSTHRPMLSLSTSSSSSSSSSVGAASSGTTDEIDAPAVAATLAVTCSSTIPNTAAAAAAATIEPRACYRSAPNLSAPQQPTSIKSKAQRYHHHHHHQQQQQPQQLISCYNELTLMSVQTRLADNDQPMAATTSPTKLMANGRRKCYDPKEDTSEHYSDVNVQVEYIGNTNPTTTSTGNTKSDQLSYYLDYLLHSNAQPLFVRTVGEEHHKHWRSSNDLAHKEVANNTVLCCRTDSSTDIFSVVTTGLNVTRPAYFGSLTKTNSDNLLPFKHSPRAARRHRQRKPEPEAITAESCLEQRHRQPRQHRRTPSTEATNNGHAIGCSASETTGLQLLLEKSPKSNRKSAGGQSSLVTSTAPTNTTTMAMAAMTGDGGGGDKSNDNQHEANVNKTGKDKRKKKQTKPEAERSAHSNQSSQRQQQQQPEHKLSQCSMCGCSMSKLFSDQVGGSGNVVTKIDNPKKNKKVKANKASKVTANQVFDNRNGIVKNRMSSYTNLSSSSKTSALNIYHPPQKISLSQQSSIAARSMNSFRESFRFTRNFNYFSRTRADSIAMPANEFCDECRCVASAVSAAARHRNALRREENSRLRQEKKAARQLGVILGAFILCWMPYIITYIVTAYCTDCVSLTVHQVTIWLGYLNSFLNPFLYALCNENFKNAFKKMLGRASPPQHFSYNFDQQTIDRGTNAAASGSAAATAAAANNNNNNNNGKGGHSFRLVSTRQSSK